MRAPQVLFALSLQDGLGEGFSCDASTARRSRASSCAIRLMRRRGDDRGPLGEILARIHAVDLGGSAAAGPSRGRRPHRRHAPRAGCLEPAATGLRAGALLARPAPAAANHQAPAGAWRLPHRQLSRRRGGRDGDPRLGGRPSRRSGRGPGLAVRQGWRFGAVDKPAGGFGSREDLWRGLRARRRRQGRSGARPLVGSVRHGALGHHLPSAGVAASPGR